MKTLSDLLRDADPLRDEAPRTAQARQRLRENVRSAHPKRPSRQTSARRRALVVAGAVLLGGLAVTKLASQRGAVDAVAAIHFEARLAAAQEAIVDNQDISTATVVPGATPTTFGVALTFTPEGAERMRHATEGHIGEHLDLLIDGEIVLSPVIRSAMSKSAMLTGDYSWEQASRIVEGLLKGKLEVRSEK
ncbi:MAG TPA: hypothetical protein VLV86_16795 [Vicinamibacterales bacterium]|nr:hypothetical protein [Vicinamibacterales bacterium]